MLTEKASHETLVWSQSGHGQISDWTGPAGELNFCRTVWVKAGGTVLEAGVASFRWEVDKSQHLTKPLNPMGSKEREKQKEQNKRANRGPSAVFPWPCQLQGLDEMPGLLSAPLPFSSGSFPDQVTGPFSTAWALALYFLANQTSLKGEN